MDKHASFEQTIGFCHAPDGVRLAYATVGDGPPLVKTANWLNHLEYDWESPIWRHLLEELARDHLLVRYDERGNGLSDWDVSDISFDAFVRDLETVVDAVGLERFSLLGISQGAAVSIAYAVRHPERVSRLILHGGYAKGWRKREDKEAVRRNEALTTLIREGWGQDHDAFRQVFTSLFVPNATSEQTAWFNELQRRTTSPENAERIRNAFGDIDVTAMLREVDVDTLVLHATDDAIVPLEEGRALANQIRSTRFVLLDSGNHLVLEQEPSWQRFVNEVRGFLEDDDSDEAFHANETKELPGEGRWSRVDALFDEALDQPPESRDRWLEEACEGDIALRAEVESLLALSENDDDLRLRKTAVPAGAVMDGLWEDVVEELDRRVKGPFEVGELVGSYRIRSVLGSGGMGQVYGAYDRKLGRGIALKVLPPRLNTTEYRRRFEREAQAIAALNHPNIVHLYSVEESRNVHFITMELVDGRTLGDLIPERGLHLKQFLELATQLADALVAAHDRGIIHRDLKPANVIVNAEGRAKILDFGVAKLEHGRFLNETSGTGESTDSATADGLIIGTVSHMSPEQAEGKSLDTRTDIFSLGVTLYEMATGERPFKGESAAALLSSILTHTPPLANELNEGIPREVGAVIKKCLAKDRDRRYQSAADIKTAFEDLQFQHDSRSLFRPTMRPSERGLFKTAAVILGALVGITLLVVYLTDGPSSRESRPLTGTFSQLTSTREPELYPSVSPDGRFVAYAARNGAGWNINLQRIGGRRTIPLNEDPDVDDIQPAFSPDGERIAFRSSREGGGLFVMGATGEFVRRLTSFGWNPAWSPDGDQLVFSTEAISRTPLDRPTVSSLWIVDVETGKLRELLRQDGVQPSWSPNGERIAYWGVSEPGRQRDIWTIPAEGGEPRRVTDDDDVDWNPVWAPTGNAIYFSSDRGGSMNLWRIRVDETSGDVLGEPEPVTAPSSFASYVSLSSDGGTLVYASTTFATELQAAGFDPAAGTVDRYPGVDGLELREVSSPDPSPVDDWVAYTREAIQEDIVLVRPDGLESRSLTDDRFRDRFPRWSFDGTRIAFYSNRSGSYEIWSIAPNGSDLRQLTETSGDAHSSVWSPDGSRMAFASPGSSGVLFDPSVPYTDQAPVPLPELDERGDHFVPTDWSADGTAIVGYAQAPNGIRAGIAVYVLETEEYEILTSFGVYPRWLPDSRRILFQGQSPARSRAIHDYQEESRLYVVDRSTRTFQEVLAVPGSSTENPALTRDGRTIFFALTTHESDLWALQFDEPP